MFEQVVAQYPQILLKTPVKEHKLESQIRRLYEKNKRFSRKGDMHINPADFSAWGDNVSIPVLIGLAYAYFRAVPMCLFKVVQFLNMFSVKYLKLDPTVYKYFDQFDPTS